MSAIDVERCCRFHPKETLKCERLTTDAIDQGERVGGGAAEGVCAFGGWDGWDYAGDGGGRRAGAGVGQRGGLCQYGGDAGGRGKRALLRRAYAGGGELQRLRGGAVQEREYGRGAGALSDDHPRSLRRGIGRAAGDGVSGDEGDKGRGD